MINQIRFFKPSSIDQACDILASESNCLPVAGGTDLIVKIRNGMFPQTAAFVDISSLPLRFIREIDGQIEIGSGCTMTEVIENPVVCQHFPTLTKAASTVGALQIRNLATIGGNSANASPAGDTIPAMFALEASVKIHGKTGSRTVKIDQFFTGPGKNVLQPGEIIESFLLPKRETRGAFLKLGERKAHAISKINLAMATWSESGKAKFRVALGSVAPTVIRAPEVEKLLENSSQPFTDQVIAEAARLATEAARPISDVRSSQAYRKQMAGVLMKRAIAAI
ncbi:MAG: FAD binding domain-containing protein [Candidatus Rifleibacteriota bacterium]